MGIQTETSNLMFLQNILHQWRIHEKRVKLWLCKHRSNAQRKDKRQNELAAKITLRHNLKRSIQITSQRPRRARWPRSLFAVVETGCEILPQSGSFHDHSKTTLALKRYWVQSLGPLYYANAQSIVSHCSCVVAGLIPSDYFPWTI